MCSREVRSRLFCHGAFNLLEGFFWHFISFKKLIDSCPTNGMKRVTVRKQEDRGAFTGCAVVGVGNQRVLFWTEHFNATFAPTASIGVKSTEDVRSFGRP